MRDIGLLAFFVVCIPFMLKRPALGFVMWVWLSVMNPHRLSYGFSHDLPFAAACACITLLGLMTTKEERRLPMTAPVVALALFTFWICFTSLFPYHPGSGYEMWSKVMKILFMTFVGIALIHSKKDINYVVWAIVGSLAYYGVKGGLFTIATGGSYLVWGPESSFIEGNNEVALALVMTIPLMRYVQIGLPKRWQQLAMTGAMLLSAFAAIGSHSRGALVAIAAMAAFLWWKSRNKFGVGIALVVAGVVVLGFMPAEWWERMNTIKSYDEDASAQGRINAWWMAFNMAKARPLGGGFDIYDLDVFSHYAPNPLDVHAAHSIYFQVMAEHGFFGVFVFVMLGASTWILAGRTARASRDTPDLLWALRLMDMIKVCMVGYAVGGAFLSLAYFDVPYYFLLIVVATHEFVKRAPKTLATRNDWRSSLKDGLVPRRPSLANVDAHGMTAQASAAEPRFGPRAVVPR